MKSTIAYKIMPLVFVAIIVAACSSRPADIVRPSLVIKYISFFTAGYESQTRNYLERYPMYNIHIYNRHQFNGELLNMLENGVQDQMAQLDSKMLRLIVDLTYPRRAIFVVDEHGVVYEEISGKKYIISKDIKEKLDKDITRFHGVVDQFPISNWWPDD